MELGGGASSLESLWLSVAGPGRRTVVVGAIYRPPAAPVTNGLELFQEQLQSAVATCKPVIILGDFNINMLDAEAPNARRLGAVLNDLGLRQLVKQATHTEPTPTLLDLIITNLVDSQSQAAVTVLPEPVADHLPVLLRAPVHRQRPPRPAPVAVRPWRRVDWDALCLELLTSDWTPLYDALDVDSKLTAFMTVWDAAVDRHCPLVTVRRRRPHCPWLRNNPELSSAMKDRDAARAEWEADRTPEARNQYRRLRIHVKMLTIKVRREFVCGSLLSERQNFWSRLKTYAMRPAGAASSCTADPDLPSRADEFNRHFAAVGSRVAAAAEAARDTDVAYNPRPARVCAAALDLHPVTLAELSDAMCRLRPSSSVGTDGVPLHVIKKCFPVIGPHFLHIVNRSIVTQVFPTAWKIARVTPVFKSGDKSNVNDYRPISILSAFSKITEKVIAMQLMSHLIDNNILSPKQYAYRPHHCTEDAAIDAVEWISQQIDRGHLASVTTIDLSKAFDSVDHGVLISKLGWCGVRSTEWFRSYLCDRKQTVTGGSSILPLTHGVAQGSILGPILFLVFINDLSCFLTHGRLLSYADDTQLLDYSPPNVTGLSSLKVRIEETLVELKNWFSANSLKMNPDKTHFILIGSKASVNKTDDFHIDFSGSEITPRSTLKFLGVTLDQHLSWESHISLVVQRCNSITASLYKVRHLLTKDVLKLLVQLHIFPHILYCLSVWGGAAQVHLQRVQKCLNFAARLVTGVRRHEHITAALESLGWARVNEWVFAHDCEYVHRALNSDACPESLRAMFTSRSQVSSHTTRAVVAGELELPKRRLALTQRCFSYRATSAWNSLGREIREMPSRAGFRSALAQVRHDM